MKTWLFNKYFICDTAVFSCKFIPFWTLIYSSQTICELGKVLNDKVNNVNLCFNNRIQIFYSAKQFHTLFIVLGCKHINADITHSTTHTITWKTDTVCAVFDFDLMLKSLSFSLYWNSHWNVVFLGLSEVGMILLPEMNVGT